METIERRHFRSIFWPLLLIAVGVALVLNNMGVLSGDTGYLLLRLWPLIFIIGGLDSLFRGEGIAGAVLSIGLGTLFLLGNFGYLKYGALELMLRLWPIFLIAIGLDVLFRGSSPTGTAIGVLLAIALVGGIFWYAVTLPKLGGGAAQTISQPLQNATQAQIHLSPAVGELEISGPAGGDKLVEGSIMTHRGETIQQQFDVSSKSASLDLTSEDSYGPTTNFGRLNTWDLLVNGTVPVEIKTNMGVGKQVFDLSHLNVTDLNAEVGVGAIEVILPEVLENGELRAGVGTMLLRVPRNSKVHIRMNGGLALYQLPDGYQRTENDIYSPGETGGQADVNLVVELPIGNLQIVYTD